MSPTNPPATASSPFFISKETLKTMPSVGPGSSSGATSGGAYVCASVGDRRSASGPRTTELPQLTKRRACASTLDVSTVLAWAPPPGPNVGTFFLTWTGHM